MKLVYQSVFKIALTIGAFNGTVLIYTHVI